MAHYEFQEQLDEAIAASADDYAFQLQVQEVLALSDFTFAQELQLHEAIAASIAMESGELQGSSSSVLPSTLYPLSNEINQLELQHAVAAAMISLPSGSTVSSTPNSHGALSDPSASSSSGGFLCGEIISDNGSDERQRREGKQPLIISSSAFSTGVANCYSNVSTPAAQIKLCPICLEPKTTADIFRVPNCSHEFCIKCMVQHVHHSLQEKKIPIRCAGVYNCDQPLIPELCQEFLPEECYDAWRVAILEAEIPDEQKVYCPFSDCSGLLVKDEALDISSAECPFCNRLFCVHCLVPWHAGMECTEYRSLSVEDRSRSADLLLHRLAREKQWQGCRRCHRIVELTQGCNHVRCRCGHEFCYLCGSRWSTVHQCVPQFNHE